MKVIAHRGLHDVEPENSLAAFRAAAAFGIDGIEFDVQATADGELVVFHDLHLDDLSSGQGYVLDATMKDVRNATLKRGSGATSDGKIPLLAEVLDLSDLSLELEVKTFDEAAITNIVVAVQRSGLEESVEFTSSHSAVLACIGSLAPSAQIGLFCRQRHPLVPETAHRRQVLDECQLLRATCLHLSTGMLDEDWVQRCRAAGLIVHAANVNDAEALAEVRQLGVDQLSTDNCQMVAAELAAHPNIDF